MSIGDKDDIFSSDEEFGGFEADFGSENDGLEETVSETAPETVPVASEKPTAAIGDDDGGEDTPGQEEAPGSDSEAPAEETPKTQDVPGPKKRARMPITKKQKAIRLMLRRAGLEELPDLDTIMRDKECVAVEISNIALFIGPPSDETLAELAVDISDKNTVNLSAEIEKNRVIAVGSEILKAGRMFQPIQVADIDGTGNLQCTSGRHRLAFLALAYGPHAEIPVYIENMSLNEARDAVVVANQARPTRAREKAEHAVLGAVGGNADAEQKAIYEATATTKVKARKYCVYSVFEKNHPIKIDFPVSMTSSRKNGELTTVSNIENFWSAALPWDKQTEWSTYDANLLASIKFLNALATAMQTEEDFDAVHHMASMTLSAIGKWYRAYREITGKDATAEAPNVARHIVSLGAIGRQKSDATYEALTELMRS